MLMGPTKCRRCARTFGKGELQASHCYEACKGTAGGRALAALTGNVNYIWADFALPAIELIKQGAAEVRIPLVPEIAVGWGQLQPFMCSAEGRHCLKGCLGDEAWHGLRRKEEKKEWARKRTGEVGQIEVERGAGIVSGATEQRAEGERESSSSSKRPRMQQQEGAAERRPLRKRPAQAMEEQEEAPLEEPVSGALEGAAWKKERVGSGAEPGEEGPPACRRRLRGKQPPPQGLTHAHRGVKSKFGGWSRGHVVHKKGSMVFCIKCGNHALKRFGKGLQCECKPTDNVASRISKLLQGLHPISGLPLASVC